MSDGQAATGGKAGIDAQGGSVARPAQTVQAATAAPATTGDRMTIAAPARTVANAVS
jgi:hypothetical protein